jgi:hypothetical protein
VVLARCTSSDTTGGPGDLQPSTGTAAWARRAAASTGTAHGGMAQASLRCIDFTYKKVVDREDAKIDDEGLTLLGFVGLKDQARRPAGAPTAASTPPQTGSGARIARLGRNGGANICGLLTVHSCIKVRLDLQADKSPVVVKGPFFPRVVNPRYRIRGTMCNARIQSSKARIAIY